MKLFEVMIFKRNMEIFLYFFGAILSLIILVFILQLWDADIWVPFYYSGDAITNAVYIKSMLDNGWYYENQLLGAPFGFNIYDFPVYPNLDIIVMKIISLVIPNYAFILNIFFLLTFPFTTISTIYVFRTLNISRAGSLIGGLIFAYLPYHFYRGGVHLFLSSYFMIPLIVLVVLWIFNNEFFCSDGDHQKRILKILPLNKKFLLSVLFCILISGTFIYYPIFSCFFICISGLFLLVRNQDFRSLIVPLLFIAIIALGVIIQSSPTIIYHINNGSNPDMSSRVPWSSEMYGLKIIMLLLPIPFHRIDILENFSQFYINTGQLANTWGMCLGILCSIGFLFLIGWIGYKLSMKSQNTSEYPFEYFDKLCLLNISAVLLGTISGFGTLIAYLISPQIRAYDRISIFIGFFSLLAVILLLDYMLKKYQSKRYLYTFLIFGLILFVGIYDQTSGEYVPKYAQIKQDYFSEESFVNMIESVMPENAMIFQLPYIPYQDKFLVNGISYDLFKGYLHSNNLKWSYGVTWKRTGDKWTEQIINKSPEMMVKSLSYAGYNGIYIDTLGYSDHGQNITSTLSKLLPEKPIISSNGRFYFFAMTPLK